MEASEATLHLRTTSLSPYCGLSSEDIEVRRVSFMSSTIQRAPEARKFCVIAFPRPPAPPVMMHVFPESDIVNVNVYYGLRLKSW